MPQARRKVPYSGKKKKDQLLQKRQLKGPQKYLRTRSDDGETTEDNEMTVRKLMMRSQTAGSGNRNSNRYNLCFYQESKKELERLKLDGLKSYSPATPEQREIDAGFYEGYDFPIRPDWNYNMDKATLDRNENKYFREYVEHLQQKQKAENKDLSLFELNLETWRQLWRVLELSDILLIIVDVRYATLMFPPYLYDYIVNKIGKQAILILNKVDLVAPEVVVAWRCYFHETYPGLPVVIFASNPLQSKKGTQQSRRMNYKRGIEGVHNIFKECQKIVQSEIDLTGWEQKILEDMASDHAYLESEAETIAEKYFDETEEEEISTMPHEGESENRTKYYKGILTLGCIGFPNVGKSSLINALKGRKVVSVSRTPGHTKHFQTIFLTNVVRLCDSPGLVFPSSTSKYLQVLLGSFPISQLQVPYRSIQLMAEHLDLPKILKIHLPEDYDEWSPVAICDAWAIKRGFIVAKSARPDIYRAANHLLRSCVSGQFQLILQFYPPKFNAQREKWVEHTDVAEVKKYQNLATDGQGEEDIHDNGDTSSINSESAYESDENSSSNDETNADEDDEAAEQSTQPSTSRNAFALLEDD
ncbi:guanine nucleotide-binding protein-like 1 [Stomoxys calcitrans]|uniref:guanine nucleotide-binding protein-like 1 n=1 Tax=Stomoxys calcitrans TaxID=35570 RepID=UPI0027E39F17|nr:guanine nucleotide-binding protein-like 1 [Stomoxys calcitrans]XP_059220903.1 guanine nucleotide-binding protein-like 1 [Stomoxys calcitrans]